MSQTGSGTGSVTHAPVAEASDASWSDDADTGTHGVLTFDRRPQPGPTHGADAFVPGERIENRYLLDGPLGRGGSGTVWRAHDDVLRRDVAIKRLAGNVAWSDEQAAQARSLALQEGRVAARLHHPRLAAIFDLVEVDTDVCLVMELIDAPALSQVVDGSGPLDPTDVAHIGAQIGEGLAAAHAEGVVHRDVKPANVLVGSDGTATLADFGVSRLTRGIPSDATTDLSAADVITGTPHFMAPEVARGEAAGPAADVYSLGATLFAAVEGHPPVGDGTTGLETLRRVAAGALTPMVHAGPIAPVLARLLDADPRARPIASEVGPLLRAAIGEPAPATGPMVLPRPAPVSPSSDQHAPIPTPASAPVGPTPTLVAPVAPLGTAAAHALVPDVAGSRRAGFGAAPVDPSSPTTPRNRRWRQAAVGSLLGAAGVCGAVGTVVALSDSTPPTPVASTRLAPSVPTGPSVAPAPPVAPRVEAPVVRPDAPAPRHMVASDSDAAHDLGPDLSSHHSRSVAHRSNTSSAGSWDVTDAADSTDVFDATDSADWPFSYSFPSWMDEAGVPSTPQHPAKHHAVGHPGRGHPAVGAGHGHRHRG